MVDPLDTDALAGAKLLNDELLKTFLGNVAGFDGLEGILQSNAVPATYEFTATSPDGIEEKITAQGFTFGAARLAAERQKTPGNKLGGGVLQTPAQSAEESEAAALAKQPVIDIQQFIDSLPKGKDSGAVFMAEEEGIVAPTINPLITELNLLTQAGMKNITNLQLQQLANDNAVAIAEFNNLTKLAEAEARGATDIELATIRADADKDIANKARLADQYAADKNYSIAKYQADTQEKIATKQGETDLSIAGLETGASGPFGFFQQMMGPPPEGGYSDKQMAVLNALIAADQQGQIDAAAATQAVGEAQAAATEAAATAQADATEAAATAQAEATEYAALQAGGADKYVAEQNVIAALGAAKANANAEIEAAIRRGASDEEIAAIQTQSNQLIAVLEADAAKAIASIQAGATTGAAQIQATGAESVAGLQAGAQTGAAQIQADAAEAIALVQADVGMDENAKRLAIAEIEADAQNQIAALQATATTSAAALGAQAASPYGYLAGGGQLSDVQAVLAGQYNPFDQSATDRLNLVRAQASGGLTNEANIFDIQKAAAATNPYAATQLGQDQERIDQILRGGLTAEQQRQLALANQAGQMQGNYLNYISNPFAVGASQTLSGGTATPFSQQQLQQMSDSPSGTVPSFAVGLNQSPFALPETQAIGAAQGLPANFTLGDWANLSDVEQQSVSGQLAPFGITPNMIGELAASYTPGSTPTVSSYT